MGLAIWKSGNVAIPLCQSHPPATLDYYISDSQSDCVIVENQDFKSKLESCSAKKVLLIDDLLSSGEKITAEEHVSPQTEDAMLLYTSGTTGSPKGVVITCANIGSQVKNMVDAWKWARTDCLLHVLPLHHVHGVVNCLLTPLTVGATIIMEPKFDADKVWDHLLHTLDVNVFMAVPTIYVKLIASHGTSLSDEIKPLVKSKLMEKMRLMVSGSAALPTPVLHQWLDISGHTLLERYGMTEIGMALTNPYNQSSRLPGHVGQPFPNVQVRIVEAGGGGDEVLVEGHYKGSYRVKATAEKDDLVGDLQVKGPSVFRGYYNRPEATAKEFTSDGGWFKTGDTAQYFPEAGSYKILGRTSVDIIKSGGYKIGALDIERILLEHPRVREVAVLGVPDDTWGQKVGAVVCVEGDDTLDLAEVNEWAKEKLPKYSLPTLLKLMEEIPKNAMGKINKKELLKIAFP